MKAIQILVNTQSDIASSRDMCDEDEVKEWDKIQEAIAEFKQLQTKHKELEAFYELVCSLVGSSNSYQDILTKLRS